MFATYGAPETIIEKVPSFFVITLLNCISPVQSLCSGSEWRHDCLLLGEHKLVRWRLTGIEGCLQVAFSSSQYLWLVETFERVSKEPAGFCAGTLLESLRLFSLAVLVFYQTMQKHITFLPPDDVWFWGVFCWWFYFFFSDLSIISQCLPRIVQQIGREFLESLNPAFIECD